MGNHPINLAVRFALELTALVAVGAFGWAHVEGPARWLALLALPAAFMAVWATFAVPDDPSRSGAAPVPVPGAVRLLLELGLFAAASLALWAVGRPSAALGLGVAVTLHYALSWDRIAWLLQR